MTQAERAQRFVERLQHDAHLRYQRQRMAPDATTTSLGSVPASEIRGCREQRVAAKPFDPTWFTHLRPNFWKAYFDTLVYMSK